MVSPNFNTKTEHKLTVNKSVKKLFQVIYMEQNKAPKKSDETPRIRVSELVSKMAFYYEKIRNSVDYNEEYLLRKNAIERTLKRQIVIEGVVKVSKSEEMAMHLLTELIRAGYLPNDKIPESKISDVAKIIEKYLKLRNESLARIKPSAQLASGNVVKAKDELKLKNEIAKWLIALAASEIEESLGRDKEKQVILSNMYEYLTENVKLPKDLPYEEDLDIQIYLSVCRHYLKFDHDMLSYVLFKYYNSKWTDRPNDNDIIKIAEKIISLRDVIEFQLSHPLANQLNKIANRYTVYYTILADVIRQKPAEVYNNIENDPKAIPRLIKQVCANRYGNVKAKLWRAAFRSIVYIFLTKSIFVFLLEMPAIKWFGEEINIMALAINVSFPAILLFVMVFFTRVPGDENTARIIEGVEELSFSENKREDPITLRKPAKRSVGMNAIFGIFYTITFFLSFGLIVWALDKINFNWVSITIFLFFLAFVSFFGLRIRKGTRELFVIDPKENVISFMIDFFCVPIILAGKWLSERVSRVNVLVFALDFIIEAPFKIFVEVAEQWTKYVKERKDDLN